jgi:hypothetical protein
MSLRPRAGNPTLGFVGLLLALVACSTRRDETESARPATDSSTTPRAIFREIDIRPFGKVTLGAPFAQRAPTAVAVGPGMFALVTDEGKFANTDALRADSLRGGRRTCACGIHAARPIPLSERPW